MIKKTILVALPVLSFIAFAGVAPAVAAEEFHTSGKVGEEVFGSQTTLHTFSVTGKEASCETVDFETKVAKKTAGSASVTPVYSGCTAFGLKATFHFNECEFVFNGKTTAGHATWDLSGCTNGGLTILVNIPFVAKCHVFIKNQTGINRVSYENSANKKELTFKMTSTNLHADVLESTGLCPLTKGTHTNATYTGNTKMVGLEGGELFWE